VVAFRNQQGMRFFMKRLSCRDLGGPCEAESHEHVMEQMQKGDEAHLSAANSMRSATPEQQKAMMAKFKQKFDEALDV
jgi:hypothetical protein